MTGGSPLELNNQNPWEVYVKDLGRGILLPTCLLMAASPSFFLSSLHRKSFMGKSKAPKVWLAVLMGLTLPLTRSQPVLSVSLFLPLEANSKMPILCHCSEPRHELKWQLRHSESHGKPDVVPHSVTSVSSSEMGSREKRICRSLRVAILMCGREKNKVDSKNGNCPLFAMSCTHKRIINKNKISSLLTVIHKVNSILKITSKQPRSWTDCSVVNSTWYFCRGPGFRS